MEIFIYSGFSELPSIDFDCLRIIVSEIDCVHSFRCKQLIRFELVFSQTFIKMHQIPVKITTGGNPGMSPNGFLPYLSIDGQQLIAGYEDILEHFKKSVCQIGIE